MADERGRARNTDNRDRRDAMLIGGGIILIIGLAALAVLMLGPSVQTIFTDSLEPGLGVKAAFAWGFGLTFAVFVVFAVVSGDGLIGELPIMLGGFLAFWLIFSLSIAWIF